MPELEVRQPVVDLGRQPSSPSAAFCKKGLVGVAVPQWGFVLSGGTPVFIHPYHYY